MTSEVSGKDLPRLRVVRLERLNEDARQARARNSDSGNSTKSYTEQAVNVTFSANAASRSAVEKVAQLAGSPLQREISVAMQQAAKNRTEDVDALAKRVADDVLGNPESALDAIGLNGGSVEVLKGSTRA